MNHSTVTMLPPDTAAPDTHDWLRDIYLAHVDVVFRYAASRCGRDTASDIVADTFVEASRVRHQFDPTRGSERAWILGIATNRIGRHRRQERRHLREAGTREAPDIGTSHDELIDTPDRIDAARLADAARHAIARLPAGERSAFLLHSVGGLDAAGVAAALGIERTAAKLRIHRARTRLRAALAPLVHEETAR